MDIEYLSSKLRDEKVRNVDRFVKSQQFCDPSTRLPEFATKSVMKLPFGGFMWRLGI